MAKKIPQSFIDDLINRTDIVDYIADFVPLKSKGDNHMGCCPFHQEKTPSFSVTRSKQFFYCFGCKESGNVIGFIMRYEHLAFTEAVEKLARLNGMEIPTEISSYKKQDDLQAINQLASQYFQYCLRKTPFGKKVIDYLKARHISGEIAHRFQIGAIPDDWHSLQKHLQSKGFHDVQIEKSGLLIRKPQNAYDRFRARVMFPIRNASGHVLGFGGRVIDDGNPKYLNSSETPLFKKGEMVYGLYETLKHGDVDTLVVVEGFMDVVSLHHHGITNVVATLGTALTLGHIKLLKRYTQKIYLCFDGDDAGRIASQKAYQTILPLYNEDLQVYFVQLPKGTDPDSLVQQKGIEAWQALLDKAIPLSDYLIQTTSQPFDLSKLEQKAAFLKKMNAYINQLPSETMQKLMHEKLTRIAQLPAEHSSTIPTYRSSNKQLSILPIQQRFIALLVQFPSCVSAIDDHILAIHFNHFDTFIEILREHRPKSTGVLMEHLQQHKLLSSFKPFAAIELHISEEDATNELIATCKALTEQELSKKINALIQKGNISGLAAEESQELNRLIKQQKVEN